jgi:hypothetical protein
MIEEVACYKIRYTEIQEREIVLAGKSEEDAKKQLGQVRVGGITLTKENTIKSIIKWEG